MGREPGNDRARIAVCICTYRRPDVLARLLERVATVARAAEARAEVSVVVVDDDPGATAAPVARASAAELPHGLQYEATAAGNIAVARNRAVEVGMGLADLLAFIDDDCMPDPGWLEELLTIQRRFGADLVTGSCVDEPPAGAEPWLREQPFLDSSADIPDGSEVTIGYLKNTLVTTDFLERTGLRFDPAFGGTGGEDSMFFYAAQDHDAHHRHAARAVVREEVPPARATLGYQLRRRLWYGNTEAKTSIASGRTSRIRMGASGVKHGLLAIGRPLQRGLHRQPVQLRFAFAQLLQGAGRVLGAAGIWLGHR